MAARVTQPVPWTSSLKQGIFGLYRSSIRRAVTSGVSRDNWGGDRKHECGKGRVERGKGTLPLSRPKSSKWIYARGYSSRADLTKVSTNLSYFSSRTRFSRRPRYRSSFSRVSLSVPQSSTTGSVRLGWMPAHSVVRASFATDIKTPPQPWSPIPRISSPSSNASVE